MKSCLLLLLLPVLCLAQNTPLQLAEDVFAMCIKNDEAAFKASLPDKETLRALAGTLKDAPEIDEQMIETEYLRNTERALKGFRMLQVTAKELGLDLSKAVITKKEVDGRTIDLVDEAGAGVGRVKTKSILLFFTCNGKKLAFRISDALKINKRWYVGHDYVAIDWLD